MELDPRRFGHRRVYVAERLVEEVKLDVPWNANLDHEFLVRGQIPRAAIVRCWAEKLEHRVVDVFEGSRLGSYNDANLVQARTQVTEPDAEISAVASTRSIEAGPQPRQAVAMTPEDHQNA